MTHVVIISHHNSSLQISVMSDYLLFPLLLTQQLIFCLSVLIQFCQSGPSVPPQLHLVVIMCWTTSSAVCETHFVCCDSFECVDAEIFVQWAHVCTLNLSRCELTDSRCEGLKQSAGRRGSCGASLQASFVETASQLERSHKLDRKGGSEFRSTFSLSSSVDLSPVPTSFFYVTEKKIQWWRSCDIRTRSSSSVTPGDGAQMCFRTQSFSDSSTKWTHESSVCVQIVVMYHHSWTSSYPTYRQ